MTHHALPLTTIGLVACLLAGCGPFAPLAGESFTLEGQLPANFAIRAQAHYGVANSCDGRSQTRSFERDFEDTPHAYRFRIPVSYRDGLCEMQLARVGLFIHGRYGDKDWQRTYDNGGLMLVDTLPEGAPGFDASGTLSKTAECTWLFQLSKARSRKGEISKLLSCNNAGAYLEYSELTNKTVKLNIETKTKEKPYLRGYWLETSHGWKPCTGRWGTHHEELCAARPLFRKFRMNNRECTVYPNCTE
ncbi:hypothetical protein AUR59_019975 [Stutzerimonas balearica]|uniref:hypothetical protein n=1 Tax=Stutzerimonas balearica TaxID=74829 RepID=UPI00097067A4|nr:hypothetical protein [Stutzerimonas balearica]MBS4150817.1 hypothetical protein [Stutzerimonas balearica]OMG61563.1 hypothetical protein AUR59_019975 [Stutzerimonas balearica]